MGKIKSLITEEMDMTGDDFETVRERIAMTAYFANRYRLQDSWQFPTGYYSYDPSEVIWEDDPGFWDDTVPETAVECVKSPTHHHEWTGSGNPKGMEWCKHCDIDKKEEGK